MLETLDPVASTELDHQQLAEQLLAQAKEHGVDLVGPNGLLNQLTKNVLESSTMSSTVRASQRLMNPPRHGWPDIASRG